MSETENECNNIKPDEYSDMALAQYVLNVLAQVVVADSCCCRRAFNGSEFQHSSHH
jgi:hypothetical protein